MNLPETGEAQTKLATGIDGLDEITLGGFLTGSIYIVRGTPGAGKTILANQICFHWARRGERCLYITLLSESHDRLIENLRKLDFFSPDYVECIHYQSGFHTLDESGLAGILRLLAEETKRYSTRIVVLDGLFALREQVDSEREFRLFMNQLQNLAHLTGATFFLLTSSERGVGRPEYTMADGWLEVAVQQCDYRVLRFIQIHKLRGSDFIDGQHTLGISDAGIRVFPRLESMRSLHGASETRQGSLNTGIAEFDTMLGDGLSFASTSLLVGPTGVGKTAFGLHYISQSNKTEPGLFFGFYEKHHELIEKAGALGITQFQQGVEAGEIEVMWHPPTEHTLDNLAYSLINAVKKRGVTRLFVDGIDVLQQAALHPERLARFLAALASTLREEGVTAMFTMETPELLGGETRIHLSAVSAVAQNIVLLRYVELASEMFRTVSVVKARTNSFDSRVRFFLISDKGVSVTGPLYGPTETLHERAYPRSPEGATFNE